MVMPVIIEKGSAGYVIYIQLSGPCSRTPQEGECLEARLKRGPLTHAAWIPDGRRCSWVSIRFILKTRYGKADWSQLRDSDQVDFA
jgi:hypothetical protein